MNEHEDVRDLTSYRLDAGPRSLGCEACPLLDICGGLTRAGGGWSCLPRCDKCDPATCDLVCLGKPAVFAQAFAEVGGFGWENVGSLTQPHTALPRYIPTIQNGSGRIRPLRTAWAALPLRHVLRYSQTGCEPTAASVHDLRRQFVLTPGTRLLLLGTGDDPDLERYWKWHTVSGLPQALAQLGWSAAVVPNYSMLLDHPRPQHLYNRKRSLICAREWRAHGIPAIPYLQAVTAADYEYWYAFLAAQPGVTVVAKEFQTGLVKRERGLLALDALARLQDRLGRGIHLLAVGGAQYREELALRFDGWTVVDSTPFIKAVKRKRGRLGERRVHWESARDRAVDALLATNLRTWSWWISASDRKGVKSTNRRRRHQLPLFPVEAVEQQSTVKLI